MTPRSVLLEALADFLRNDLQPQLSGYLGYQNRVATNLLRLLEREEQFGAQLRQLDARMGEELGLDGDATPAALARALRGKTIIANRKLRDYLRLRSLLALAIDNPRYSGYQQARERWPALAREVDGLTASRSGSPESD
ncbi:MAG: hypothetical protein ACI87W_002833 [Halieaceae bacterium]|jgi:hypothetical protein